MLYPHDSCDFVPLQSVSYRDTYSSKYIALNQKIALKKKKWQLPSVLMEENWKNFTKW